MTYYSRVIETEPPTDWQVRPEPRPTSVNGSYRAHAIDYVDRFHDLVRRWRLETAFSSSVMEKIANPAFQQIVHMGPKV